MLCRAKMWHWVWWRVLVTCGRRIKPSNILYNESTSQAIEEDVDTKEDVDEVQQHSGLENIAAALTISALIDAEIEMSADNDEDNILEG